MRGNRVARIVLLVAAVHVAVLSVVLGPRHVGYLVSATLSATLIWGGVFVLDKRRRQAGVVAGIIAGLVVQQVAYQVWKGQLGGFLWPLAQFGSLQGLVACGVWRFGL